MKQLTFLVFLFASNVVFAQEQVKKPVAFGIETGINIATVRYSPSSIFTPADAIKSKTGLRIGILLDIPLAANFSIETGLAYSKKGVQRRYYIKGISGEGTYRYNYLEIPLFFKCNISNFVLAAGPYIAPAVGTNLTAMTIDTTFTEKGTIGKDPASNTLNPFDFGVNIKAGYQAPFGLFFTAQYGLGLTDFLPSTGLVGKHRVFSVSIGYYFNQSPKPKQKDDTVER